MPSTPDSRSHRTSPRPALQRGLVLGWLAAAALAAGLALPTPAQASGVQALAAAPVEARRMLRGPTLVAVLPPEARASDDPGAREAVAHVHFALNEARRCLGGAPVRFELVYAERLTLVAHGKGVAVALGDTLDGISVVLAEPDRPPSLVQSPMGASALQHLLPQALFEYWRAPDCKRE